MRKFLLTLVTLMTAATATAGHYVIFNPSETPPISSSPDGTVINHQDGIQISLYGPENGATDDCYFFSSYMYIFAFVNPGYRLMSVEFVGAPYLMIFEYYYAYHQQRGHTAIEGNSAIWQDGYYDQDGAFHPYAEEDYKNGIVEADPHYSDGRFSNGVVFLKFASPNWCVNINEIKIYVYDPNEEPPTPEYIEVAAPVISTTMDDDNVYVSVEWPESTGEHIYNGEYTYPRGEENAQYEVEAYVSADGLYLESAHATATIEVPAKKTTAVDEVNIEKSIAKIRYFNMAGQEMPEANGLTIVVTTYTDGTTTAAKVMK